MVLAGEVCEILITGWQDVRQENLHLVQEYNDHQIYKSSERILQERELSIES